MVPDRRGLCAVAVEQFLEPRIPEAATGHLDRLAGLLHTCRHVEVAYIYVYSELFRYIRGMAHVAHRLLSAQVEVTVRRAAVIAQARQYGQQRHRVGTAAQGHYHRGRLDTGSSDSWYKTEEEVKASIAGLYRVEFFPIDGDSWTDNHQSRDRLNDFTAATLNGESWDVKNRWQNAYKSIARCNILLNKLASPSEIGINEEKAELYRAQVLFVRATQYGILTSCFGDVVWVDREISIDDAFTMGRTDREEVMEKVYADYDRAAAALPLSYGTRQELATKSAALALKARYALYNEDWDIAAKAAKDCMDLGCNELYPDFGELFLSSTHHAKENLLSWPYSLELGIHTESEGYIQGLCPRNRGGYGSEYPSWDLFASFLCTDGLPIDESPRFNPQKPFENRDPRCAYTVVEFGTQHCGVIYDPNPNVTEVYSSISGNNITNLVCKSGSQYA